MGCLSEDEKKINGFRKWEVEDALHTLKRAGEIKRDKKKMKAVKKLFPEYFKKEKREIESLQDLRDMLEDGEDEESGE